VDVRVRSKLPQCQTYLVAPKPHHLARRPVNPRAQQPQRGCRVAVRAKHAVLERHLVEQKVVARRTLCVTVIDGC
jgi:hypothetical protein